MKICIILIILGTSMPKTNLYSQGVPWITTGNTITGTEWFGASTTSTIPLRLEHKNGLDINFWTNTLWQMVINGSSGNVGIGNGVTTAGAPPYKLTVESDIDIECGGNGPPTEGYRYNGALILSAPVSLTNIIVGPNAGLNTTGVSNSMLGEYSGYTNSTGEGNVFMGSAAGLTNDVGSYNSFGGFQSGYSNEVDENTFYGAFSGLQNSSGLYNSFIGTHSGENNTVGEANTFFGFESGYTNISTGKNTFVGFQAGKLNIADNNTFSGWCSGQANTTGTGNSFYGLQSGYQNSTVSRNTHMGQAAGNTNQTGNDNSCIGYMAGFNLKGNDNTLMGSKAGYTTFLVNGNTSLGARSAYYLYGGDNNTIIGTDAGFAMDVGDDNTFVGHQSGKNNATGEQNTFVGKDAGIYNSTGTHSTYLGFNSGQQSGGSHAFVYSTALGANAIVRNDYHMILGDNNINVGIGLSNDATGPRDKLEIKTGTTGVSGLQFTDLTSSYNPGSTAAKFLTVDANGKVILKDMPGGGGSVSACSSVYPPGDNNFVTKWSSTSTTEICKSQIYDDATNVGIGYGAGIPSNTPPYKLAINGNLRLGAASNAFYLNTDRFLCAEGGSYTSNVYLGINAGPPGANDNQGYGDICIGGGSGNSLTDHESNNILIGANSGVDLAATTNSGEADGNVFLGYSAGDNFTIGNSNVCIGTEAGNGSFTTESYNVIIGNSAGGGGSAGAGSENIIIGNIANFTHTGTDGSIAIGAHAVIGEEGSSPIIGASNSVALGQWARCNSINCISLGDCGSGGTNVRTLMGYTNVPAVGTSPAPPGTGFRLYVNSIANTNAAYFSGRVFENGNYVTSDSTLKSNIQDVNPQFVNQVIDHLSPKSYTFDIANNPSLNLESGQQYGLLAQEVEAILPGLVTEVTAPAMTDNQGNVTTPEKTFKALNYTGLVPFLIQKVKNQSLTIDSLKAKDSITNARIDLLEQMINNCCNQGHLTPGYRMHSPIDVELNSENTIILNQNDPNPFAENTKITYNVPADVNDAAIIFYDNSGHVLQTVKINERGQGQINVYGEKLSSGIYSYTLIADGKVIDTKKMVCNK